MDRFWQDIRFGVRLFRRSPGFLAMAVLALGLGIGANTAVFSVVHGVLLAPLPYPDPERLVVIYDTQPDCKTCPASFPKPDTGVQRALRVPETDRKVVTVGGWPRPVRDPWRSR